MKNIVTYTLLIFILFSCSNENEKPADILSEDEMTLVLVDLELVQAEIKFYMAYDKVKAANYQEEFNVVLDKHNLTVASFNKNVEYYCSKPLLMQDVYVKVIEILSEQQSAKPN